MKEANLLALILAAFLLTICSSPQSNPTYSEIDVQLDSLLSNSEFKALSVGVIIGEEAFTFHKGKLLNGDSPTDETLYEIASLTKTFTGTLLAYAIDEGKVNIDDDIRKYLSDSLPNLEYENQPITFRHLVTHQSGLPNMIPNQKGLFSNPNWDKLPFEINKLQEGLSRKDFFDELKAVEIDTFPGVGFNYSNAGANLTGYLLEEIYDKSYADLLRDKILIPLQMENTKISTSDIDLRKLAYGQNTNGVKMPTRAEKNMNAEGGVIATTADMLKYLRFHLDEESAIVSLAHQHLWNGQYGDYEAGLYWQIKKNGEAADRVFQNGGAFGTSSWVTIIPEQNLGIFIVTNVSGPDIHQKLSEETDKIINKLEQSRL